MNLTSVITNATSVKFLVKTLCCVAVESHSFLRMCFRSLNFEILDTVYDYTILKL